LVFDPRFAWADADCGAAEHYWLKHRKVAAECRWGGDVFAADDAGGSSGAGVPEAWVGDAFHPGEYEAYLELGYGELLVADRVCVYRARIGFRDERGGAQSPADAAARGVWRRGADCADVHRGDICDSHAGSRRRFGPAERCISRDHNRLDRAQGR